MTRTTSLSVSIFFIFFNQVLLGCGQNSQHSNVPPSDNIKLQEMELSIDTFSTFPAEIDGCACYFSNNEKEFLNHTYIYADDYRDIAFISINGVMTKFKLSTSDISADRTIETFINDEYRVTVNVKQVGQLDETVQKEGALTITHKDGKEIIKKIYGECGC